MLLDDRAWPVLRVPFDEGHAAAVVYRNHDDDPGLDFLLTHPDGTRAQVLLSYDGDRVGPGLRRRELTHIANAVPDSGTAEGVLDPAARLLLLLPALVDGRRHSPVAVPRIADALVAVGAPAQSAALAAEGLVQGLGNEVWHDPAWGSPLSGGASPTPVDTASRESGVLRNAGVTVAQWKRLARALGEHGEPHAGVGARRT